MTTNKKKKEVFSFLFKLQRIGATNMFGAAPYIQKHCNIKSSKEAGDLLVEWMSNYDELLEAREKN